MVPDANPADREKFLLFCQYPGGNIILLWKRCCLDYSNQAFTFTQINQQVVGGHEGASYRKGQINHVEGLFYDSVLLFSMWFLVWGLGDFLIDLFTSLQR